MSEEFDNQDFDDFFREHLQDYKSNPPFSWKEMQEKIPNNEKSRPHRRWLISLLAALFILFIMERDQLSREFLLLGEEIVPELSVDAEAQIKTNLEATSSKQEKPKDKTSQTKPSMSSPAQELNPPLAHEKYSTNHSKPSKVAKESDFAFQSINSDKKETNEPLSQNAENVLNQIHSIEKVSKQDASPKPSTVSIPLTQNIQPIQSSKLQALSIFAPALSVNLQELAQEPKPQVSPLYLTLRLSPQVSYYRLTPNKTDDKLLVDIPEAHHKISENLGFRANFQVEKQFNKHWSGALGAAYATQKSTLSYTYSPSLADSLLIELVNREEFIVNPIRQDVTERIQFQTQAWGFQGNARYHLGGNWQAHSFGLGLAYEQVTQTTLSQGENTHKFKNGSLAININYRFTKTITPRWQFTLEPYVHYYVGSVYQDSAIQDLKPYQLGLSFGLAYRLR